MDRNKSLVRIKIGIGITAAIEEIFRCQQIFMLLFIALVLTGCASKREFMPTPNIFHHDVQYTAPNTIQNSEDPNLEIVYITNRANETPSEAFATYNNRRSSAAAFSVEKISLTPEIDWETLTSASTGDNRKIELTYGDVIAEEQGRFPESPYLFSVVDGKIVIDAEEVKVLNASKDSLRKLIVSELEKN